jgi:hypothetical protein
MMMPVMVCSSPLEGNSLTRSVAQDGIAATEAIVSRNGNSRVVGVTGNALHEDIQKFLYVDDPHTLLHVDAETFSRTG